MSYTVNIPFSNITYYEGNRQTAYVNFDGPYSKGSYIHWGSNWDGSHSTVYDIAKIKIDISNLNLPSALPNGTKLQFTVKNIRNWCGAEYLNGHITQTNFTAMSDVSTSWADGYQGYGATNTLQNATLGMCYSSGWGNGMEGVTFTFTGTANGINSSKAIYLYILDTVHNFGNPGSTTSYFQEDHLSFKLILPYTSVTEPSNQQLKVNGVLIDSSTPYKAARDTVLALSWSAAQAGSSNPVAGYKIHYGVQGQDYSQSLILGNVTSYNLKISDNFGGPRKGTTFLLGIQALATHENLNSNIVPIGYITVINKAPEPPTFEVSGTIRINDGTTSTISVLNLQGIDADDDGLEYYYQLKSSNGTKTNEQPLPLNLQIATNKNYPYLLIRSKDTDGAYSQFTEKLIKINSEPNFNFQYTINESDRALSINGSKEYVNAFTNISCNFTNQTSPIVKYNWRIGTTSNLDKNFTSSTINYVKIEPLEVGAGGGEELSINLTITDSAGDTFSSTKTFTKQYYRLQKRTPQDFQVLPQEENSQVSGLYISDIIKMKLTVAQPLDEVQRILKFYRQTPNPNGGYESNILQGSSLAKNGQSLYENYISGAQDGILYKFRAELIDPFNNKTETQTLNEYMMLGSFNIATFDFSKRDWHPLKDYIDYKDSVDGDPIVVFTSQYLDNKNTIGNNCYSIEAIYNDQSYTLAEKIGKSNPSEGWTIETNGSTIYFLIKNFELYKKLKLSTNSPQISVTYKITGYNAFDRPGASLKINGTITTQERPSFLSFNGEETSYLTAVINSNSKSQYNNWFNPGDSVNFIINGTPFDYNDTFVSQHGQIQKEKSIKFYEIGYKYLEDNSWTVLQQLNALGGNGEYLSNIAINSMPSLNLKGGKTEVLFGLRLVDDTNLKSDFLTLPLYACRKVNPIFNISSATIENETSEGKIVKVILKSIDLGGNDNKAENFQRSGKETYEIILQIGQENGEFVQEFASTRNNSDFNTYSNEKGFVTEGQIILPEGWNRAYIKAKVVIKTNSVSQQVLETTTTTYLFYLNEPTMSHRSHWIGINTTANKEEDVFHVSSFNQRKNIRLSGFYESDEATKDIEIIIDLGSGKLYSSENFEIDLISGTITNARIEGGNW